MCLISPYLANSKKETYAKIAKRALWYLKGTLHFGLFYIRKKRSKLLVNIVIMQEMWMSKKIL